MSDFPVPVHQPGARGTDAADPPVALRRALVDAIGRRRRRVRSRVALAGAACFAVAAAVLVGGAFTGGPARVLAIDDGRDWVTVRILDGEAGAEQMTQELQDSGIDAEVQALPARPDDVGRWLGFNPGREPPPPACDLPEGANRELECANAPLLAGDDIQFGEDAFRIRRDAIYRLGTTRTTFYVGREPEPGETPVEALPRGVALEFLYPEMDRIAPDLGRSSPERPGHGNPLPETGTGLR